MSLPQCTLLDGQQVDISISNDSGPQAAAFMADKVRSHRLPCFRSRPFPNLKSLYSPW